MRLSGPMTDADFDRAEEQRAARKRWHPWFVWFPVRTIRSQWVWLETVERVHFMSPEITAADYIRSSGFIWAYRIPATALSPQSNIHEREGS